MLGEDFQGGTTLVAFATFKSTRNDDELSIKELETHSSCSSSMRSLMRDSWKNEANISENCSKQILSIAAIIKTSRTERRVNRNDVKVYRPFPD